MPSAGIFACTLRTGNTGSRTANQRTSYTLKISHVDPPKPESRPGRLRTDGLGLRKTGHTSRFGVMQAPATNRRTRGGRWSMGALPLTIVRVDVLGEGDGYLFVRRHRSRCSCPCSCSHRTRSLKRNPMADGPSGNNRML